MNKENNIGQYKWKYSQQWKQSHAIMVDQSEEQRER
jgi:hypothetical protein